MTEAAAGAGNCPTGRQAVFADLVRSRQTPDDWSRNLNCRLSGDRWHLSIPRANRVAADIPVQLPQRIRLQRPCCYRSQYLLHVERADRIDASPVSRTAGYRIARIARPTSRYFPKPRYRRSSTTNPHRCPHLWPYRLGRHNSWHYSMRSCIEKHRAGPWHKFLRLAIPKPKRSLRAWLRFP